MRNLKTVFVSVFTGIVLQHAQSGYALVSTEIGAGQKTNVVKYDLNAVKNKKKSITGQEMFANIFVDPVPMVPVAFGVSVLSSSYDKSKVAKEVIEDTLAQDGTDELVTVTSSVKSATLLYGPTLKVWAPIPYVKPYIKASYLMGSNVETAKASIVSKPTSSDEFDVTGKGKSTYSVTQSDIGLGIGFSPIKILNVFCEYSIQTGSSKLKSYSDESVITMAGESSTATSGMDEVSAEEKASKSFSASSVRLGLSVGF